MDISRYHRQHEEIKTLANDLAKNLDIALLRQDPSLALGILPRLSGKLILHLSLEDEELYPKFMALGDAGTKNTAEEFQTEMGGLAKVFKDYISEWSSHRIVQNNPEKFVEQTKAIYVALSNRIKREESVLYPLAEAI